MISRRWLERQAENHHRRRLVQLGSLFTITALLTSRVNSLATSLELAGWLAIGLFASAKAVSRHHHSFGHNKCRLALVAEVYFCLAPCAALVAVPAYICVYLRVSVYITHFHLKMLLVFMLVCVWLCIMLHNGNSFMIIIGNRFPSISESLHERSILVQLSRHQTLAVD